MSPQTHLMLKVDTKELVSYPQNVLHKMSIKIQERRLQIIQGLIKSTVKFETNEGVKQGVCERIDENICYIRLGQKHVCADINQIVL